MESTPPTYCGRALSTGPNPLICGKTYGYEVLVCGKCTAPPTEGFPRDARLHMGGGEGKTACGLGLTGLRVTWQPYELDPKQRVKLPYLQGTYPCDACAATVLTVRCGPAPETHLSACHRRRANYITYMRDRIEDEDWHGVSDAANDLRELDAEIRTLEGASRSGIEAK